MLKDIIKALYDCDGNEYDIAKTLKKCQLFLSDRKLYNIDLTQLQSIIYQPQTAYKKHLALYTFIVNQLHSKKYNISDIYFNDLNLLWSYIALFDALKQSDQMMFISIRIKDPRNLLHPHTDLCTAKYLASMYNILYWLTRSISQSFLYMVNCSPLCELAVTLSRATLLIAVPQSLADLKKAERELNTMLLHIGLPIEIMIAYEIINVSDKEAQSFFINAVKDCNKSDITKKEEKTNFYLSPNDEIHDIQQSRWHRFNNTIAPWIVCNNSYKYCNSMPVEITVPLHCSKHVIYEIPLVWEKNYNVAKLYNGYIKQFSQLSFTMSRLRLDVGGFLDSMLLFGDYKLDLHQTYRSYHDQFFYFDISYIIQKHQDIHNSVFLMHAVLDDGCLIGDSSTLEVIATELKKLYEEKYGGKLKYSIESFQEGYTVADWSVKILKRL